MDDSSEFERLDRELTAAADRQRPLGFDASNVRRRVRGLERGPWGWLLLMLGFVAAAAVQSPWYWAAGIAVLFLPGAILGIVDRRRELAALDGEGDLLAAQQKWFAERVRHEHFDVGGCAAGAFAFGVWALATGSIDRAIVAGVAAAVAAVRLVWILPPLARANRDVGGAPTHWIVVPLVFGLLVVLPFYALFVGLRAVWRRVAGRSGGRA